MPAPLPETFPVTPPTEGKTNEILIMGQRFPIEGDVKVITYDLEGAFSFYATPFKTQPNYGPRFEKPGVKITTIEQLFANVHQMIIHTDLTDDSAGCFRALVGRDLSTHFMVDWDGILWQPLDLMDCGYHAGGGNMKSIGLDMNNRLPPLHREPNEPAYRPDYSRIDEVDQKKKHKRNGPEVLEVNGAKVKSYGYTDPQYHALINLLKKLTALFTKPDGSGLKVQYPVDAKGDVVGRTLEDPLSFQGFMAHWHWETQRWDPGPAFDWQRVFHGLGNEHNAFPVEFEDGVNIGKDTLLDPNNVKEYVKRYYANNELETTGWYPMGINQTWHGGVHIAIKKGTKVRAMTDGVLVAARFGKKPTRLGHNNFILLRHSINVPSKVKDQDPKKFIFYSLYMHLLPIDVTEANANDIDWVKEMYRVSKGDEGEGTDSEEEETEKDHKDEKKSEGEEEDKDEGGEEEDEDEFSKEMWLKLSDDIAALKSEQIAKMPWKKRPIRIPSSAVIGYSGEFGTEDDWKPQIHFEVFADTGWKEAIDIAVHGRSFVELDDDVEPDLFVENRDILSLFGTPARRGASLVPDRILDQATIEEFWSNTDTDGEEAKGYLRKVVVRHVSEWSDKVDWVSSLSSADNWDGKVSDFKQILAKNSIGRNAIATVLPFIWLSKDLAEHIGLDVSEWRGILDHFHPIHFLMWLTYSSTQRIQTLSSGVSSKDAKKKAKERERLTEECRLKYPNRQVAQQLSEQGDVEAGKCFDFLTDEDKSGSTQEVIDTSELPDVELLKEYLNESDQGEWKRVSEEDE
jgi:N-acetyl-anhydromuramyl-L-alanine amidase AmpD